MNRRQTAEKKRLFGELSHILEGKLKPPFGIVLGSPNEVTDVVASLPAGEVTCYQMDLFQADRLREHLREFGLLATVSTAADLWDLPGEFGTLIYPVPLAGERSLKLDMVEQSQHLLPMHGTMVVVSPYEKDELFPQTLKKVYGKVHSPMAGDNKVLWTQKTKVKPRRRHEMTFQVNAGDGGSLRFVSRPGVFSHGRFDDGARALVETMEIDPGARVLDMGCGCGTNGIFAARRAGPAGKITFVDSNLRAIALAELNARNLGVENFDTVASCTLEELPRRAFDVVLANPPYYAQLSIARKFMERAWDVLRPRGKLFLVTRQADQIGPELAELFGPVEVVERRGYAVLCTQKSR